MSSNTMIDAIDVATALGEYIALTRLVSTVSKQADEALGRYQKLNQELEAQHVN